MIPLPCNLITLWKPILLDSETIQLRYQTPDNNDTQVVVYEALPEMIC